MAYNANQIGTFLRIELAVVLVLSGSCNRQPVAGPKSACELLCDTSELGTDADTAPGDPNSASDVVGQLDGPPADVGLAGACTGTDGALCSAGPCTKAGKCLGGKCVAEAAWTYDVVLDKGEETKTIWGRARPDGTTLVLTRNLAGGAGSEPALMARLLSPMGLPLWSTPVQFDAAPSEFFPHIADTGEQAAVFFLDPATGERRARIISDNGTVGPVLKFDTPLKVYDDLSTVCGDTIVMIGHAGTSMGNHRLVLRGFDLAGQIKWTSELFFVQDIAGVNQPYEWFGGRQLLCRPEAGVYWKAAHDAALIALGASGENLWLTTEGLHVVIGVGLGEVLAHGTKTLTSLTYANVIRRISQAGQWQADIWISGFAMRVPGIAWSGQWSYLVSNGFGTSTRADSRYPTPASPHPRMIAFDPTGKVSWIREFAPLLTIEGGSTGQPDARPVPGGGWDFEAFAPATPPNTGLARHLIRLDHLGRLECDVDKCAGIKTLNACDDGDPTTLDWCKQTVGCTHLKVE